MPKIYLKEIDKQQAVLEFLEENPRQTRKQISAGLQLSKSTVYQTIQRLGGCLIEEDQPLTSGGYVKIYRVSYQGEAREIVMGNHGNFDIPPPHQLMALYGGMAA